jgi:CRISPR-associated exonuclease Cas4
MTINATLINIYNICRREAWLHAHAIRMEHTSEVVYEGKLIGEMSYPQRAERYTELELSDREGDVELSAKIDFYDPYLGVVHEVKKSAAREQAHITQVQFYLYLLRKKHIKGEYGIIEYPKQRQTERVELDPETEQTIARQIKEVHHLVSSEMCPPPITKSKCRSCSYFDFCWVEEEDPSITPSPNHSVTK